MTFNDIADRFVRAESGSDFFKDFYKEAFLRMKSDPENASLYFVVGIAAKSYVQHHEDQGVPPELADRAKTTMVEYSAKVIQALTSEPAQRFRLLSEISLDYEWNLTDF